MRGSLVLTLIVLVSGSVAWAQAPIAVSPGHASKVALVEARCPTFSWGAVSEVEAYELVVYRLGEEGDKASPVLERRFNGSVTNWTPSLEACLIRGGRYAWIVRAVGGKTEPEWSAPRLFEVSGLPSEFEEVLLWLRKTKGLDPVGKTVPGSGAAQSALSGGPESEPRGEARGAAVSRSAAAGDSSMQVNGSPVVTVATLGGALCAATELRFLDRGDGTVLDCNTNLIWMKDPNCFGVQTWQDALDDAAALADGMCGLTDGSVAGDWRLPTISELCSAGEVEGTCPTENAVESLANTNFSLPALSNAVGDRKWREDDPFIDAGSTSAWSSTEFDAVEAYFLEVGPGEVIVDTKAGSFNDTWAVREP